MALSPSDVNTTNATANNPEKKKREGRSPNFPSMNLQKAIEKTGKIDAHPVPITLLPNRLGYSGINNSAFQQAIACLRAYGLISVDGEGDKRVITISERGRRITKGAPDRDDLLKEAALTPSLIRELWEKYKDYEEFPKDDIIKNYLVWERKPPFFGDAADKFISIFQETIAFSNLRKSDIFDSEVEETDSSNNASGDGDRTKVTQMGEKHKNAPPSNRIGGGSMPDLQTEKHKNFTFPLIGGDIAILQVPHPMSEANFNILTAILNAMKSALVSESTPATQTLKDNHGKNPGE